MKRTGRKSNFAGSVLIVLLIVFIAVLVKYTFTEEEQSTDAFNNIIADRRPGSAGIEELNDILILVNKDNMLPSDYKVNLCAIDRVKVAKVLVNDLKEMRKAAKRENIYIYIGTAYRTKTDQKKEFNNAVFNYVQQGNSQDVAVERAKQVAALPGYSEHETGLAIDFSFSGNYEKQAEMWDWLSNNAYKYGFILRYPESKEYITGYNYEPWHYRYVGKQNAKAIYEQDLVLEEYLQLLCWGA